MKLFKDLFNFITAAGIFLLIGTAGLSDNSCIQLGDIVPNIFTAFNIIMIGIIGGKVIRLPKKEIRKKKARQIRTEII